MNSEIFIPGNTASSKNSKVWTGRYLVWSKAAQKYRKETKKHFTDNETKFKALITEHYRKNPDKPVLLGMHFIRKSRHQFDFNNVCQTIQDILVENNWFADDNMNYLIPIPIMRDGKFYSYDKNNPGVILKILNLENNSISLTV